MPRANRYHIRAASGTSSTVATIRSSCSSLSGTGNVGAIGLYEAKKQYGLCVRNYIVTSNHVPLLVVDTTEDVIPQSMQLIADRTGQEHNQRKKRKGAFWEDRYHAIAVETDKHLARCLVYIDLNMVRTGV